MFAKQEGAYATRLQQLEQIGIELKFLIKGIQRSPKSYSLWYHRQWTIKKGLVLEAEVNKKAAEKKGEGEESKEGIVEV